MRKIILLLTVIVFCTALNLNQAGVSIAAKPADEIRAPELKNAIHSAALYLAKICDKNGKFTYRINLNPKVNVNPKYNMLRHAGTLYAMATYVQKYPHTEVHAACNRAAHFLKEKSLAPVDKRADLLAVWSYPEITRRNAPVQAKLGGTGLGLVALLSLEKISPGTTSRDVLRGMGRFILYMQKQDGSFYSKYIPQKGGRDDSWTSLYYPGEAALGLLMLYEYDPSPLWLEGAAKAISFLAQSRKNKTTVPADHWALLATARLLPVYGLSSQPVPRTDILRHAEKICKTILANPAGVLSDTAAAGALTRDGSVCPTATRLEGILAAFTFLQSNNPPLSAQISSAAHDGIAFLIRAQILSGQHAGAFPRAVRPLPSGHPRFDASFNRRATEIRIDYIQHALSALMQYKELFLKGKP